MYSAKASCEETFRDVLKDKIIGLVRGDSGFYTEDLLNYLETEPYNYIYIIAARIYPNVKHAVGGLKEWIELSKGIHLNEMRFKHEKGKLRRYILDILDILDILVRKQVEIRPEATGKILFEDLPGYRYSCYVTNLDLPLGGC